MLLSFMEPVILLLLLDFGPGDVLLVSILIDLGVPHVGSTHFNGLMLWSKMCNGDIECLET